MSCYLRHLSGMFAEVGVEYSKDTRNKVDRSIRTELGMENEDCPVVWKKVKVMLQDPDGRDHLEQLIKEATG